MGQKPHSKRKRKQAAQNSLKNKQTFNANLDDQDLSSPPVTDQDSNALILPSNERVASQEAQVLEAKPKLSKSQMKKQRKVEEELKKREQRAQVYESLQQHSLSDAHHALIMPAHMLGQSETKRQQLRRALQHQRAGIALPDGSRLEQERLPHNTEANAAQAEQVTAVLSGSESGFESGAEAAAGFPMNKRRKLKQQDQAPAGAPGAQSQAPGAESQAPGAQSQGPGESQALPAESKAPGSESRASRPEPRVPGVESRAPGVKSPLPGSRDAAGQAPKAAVDAAQELQAARNVASGVKQELGIADQDGDAAAAAAPQHSLAGGPTRVRRVQRRGDIEAVRSNLPITGMEQEIMEALIQNDVVVLCGETGCGKTTQVPQFLYEAGYGCSDFPERAGMIGVTQPRRVAAVSTATRVADELDCPLGTLVGYQVRYDRKASKCTSLKFMTDGILLRELQEDFLLTKYSSIIIDEAHERSLNTDLLLGLLSRVVPLRRSMSQDPNSSTQPLKLLIMSATLRVSDFVDNRRLFPTPPPLVHVPARHYPVTVHFNRRTELDDYVGAAYQKVCKIHRQLPPGGVLVFLTGQREVEHLCQRLRQAFDPRQSWRMPDPVAQPLDESTRSKAREEQEGLDDLHGGDAVEVAGEGAADPPSDQEAEAWSEDDMDSEEEDMPVLGGEGFTPEELAKAEQHFTDMLGRNVPVNHMPSIQIPDNSPQHGGASTSREPQTHGDTDSSIDGKMQGGSSSRNKGGSGGEQGPGPVQVLPLYANLPQAAQAQVFRAVPAGTRLIVVATNVAETSLTIPGMRYVVDAGRSKQKILAEGGALAEYAVRWISKASSQQRAGRSGRTGPGHCYRLYSSAHFNDTFPEHSPPEILNTSLEGLVLLMKAMHVDKVVHFPFPTSPEAGALKAAQACLVALSALQPPSHPTQPLGLTPLGRAMSAYPITPRHSRMLLQAALEGRSGKKGPGILPYAVALAAALSVEIPFIHADSIMGEGEEEEQKQRRQSARGFQKRFLSSHGDAVTALNVLCAFQQADDPPAFCRQHYLHERNLKEMTALQAQLSRAVAQKPPSQQLGLTSRQQHGAGPLQEPLKADVARLPAPSALIVHELRKAMAAGWVDQVARRMKAKEQVDEAEPSRKGKRAVRYQACNRPGFIFLHPRSNLRSTAPEFVVYTQLISTAKRPYMAGVTAIEASWLAEVGHPLCTWSGPLPDPPPAYQPEADAVQCWQRVSFGMHDWHLPMMLTDVEDRKARTAAFAVALLEGKVLPILAGLRKAWLMPPLSAARQDVSQQHQLHGLAETLEQHKIDSRASLAHAWQSNPSLLKPELSLWLRKSQRKVLDTLWQTAVAQALQRL